MSAREGFQATTWERAAAMCAGRLSAPLASLQREFHAKADEDQPR